MSDTSVRLLTFLSIVIYPHSICENLRSFSMPLFDEPLKLPIDIRHLRSINFFKITLCTLHPGTSQWFSDEKNSLRFFLRR